MPRRRYNISEDEIKMLLNGVLDHGPQETYKRMKLTLGSAMDQHEDLDEICMDMYEEVLDRARTYACNDNEDQEVLNALYQVASMLRFAAHELHKSNKNSSRRFIELVYQNTGETTFIRNKD